jgi:cellulose synthase/poly-beta-1,6-N-acetylglucosamine synthase-like glycosyltransferase
MQAFLNVIFYLFTFTAVYVQVFLLVVFLERRKDVLVQRKQVVLKDYPEVDIIVPCWNEEKTVEGTILSLLALDYPKDKLKFYLVDDGSTDGTWEVMKRYAENPQVEAIRKENGGKHTAVNEGIARSKGEFIACLDADSFVDPAALKRMLTYFSNPKIMAVSPTVVVYKPKTIVQLAQKADYTMAAYIKKMFASVNGLHVASGSFTVFRRKVFETIGNYRNAHNTEDFEITLRMYASGMRIDQCNDAYVYTVAPSSIRKLFKQRLRWMFGFIENIKEYRFMLLRKRYGPVAMITLPAGIISMFSVIYIFVLLIVNLVRKVVDIVLYYRDTGILFHTSKFHFDWFFFNTGSSFFLLIMLYSLLVVSFLLGKKIHGKRASLTIDLLYFITIYSVVAPMWLLKAMYNSIAKVKTSWR